LSFDKYLRSVGLDPEKGCYPWCASWVYWVAEEASKALDLPNPCPRLAGALRMRDAAAGARVKKPVRGALFFIDKGQGKGHVGIVESVVGVAFKSIEANTNAGGSREGDGVYRRIRTIEECNGGFVDLTKRLPTRADVA